MNREKFYELADIETPEDFKFYDNVENLVEADEQWDADLLWSVISEVDGDTLKEIFKEYFQSLMEKLPEDNTELYTLIYNTGRAITGLAGAGESDRVDNLRRLSEELERFSGWFSRDSKIEIQDVDSGDVSSMPLRDALAYMSLEKLGMGNYIFNFDGVLDYEVDEYVINLMDWSIDDDNAEEADDENR
ncbi:MAG: hypothetical protein MR269_05040 [Clostridiales bacterium]|nr:hypothetical protein [Clostridiales bacterium]